MRRDRFTGRYAFHPGIDFAGPWGSVVHATAPGKVLVVVRVPRRFAELVRLPRPTLLDAYVGKAYLRVLVLAFAGMLGIFYIGSFIDWSDNLFKGQATAAQLAQYMWYSTPQFVYYVLPLSALVGTLALALTLCT